MCLGLLDGVEVEPASGGVVELEHCPNSSYAIAATCTYEHTHQPSWTRYSDNHRRIGPRDAPPRHAIEATASNKQQNLGPEHTLGGMEQPTRPREEERDARDM